MARSTKTLLAESLKRLVNSKPLDKITVKELVEDCGINRQTFYYNFQDIYDLLEWVFEEDARRILEEKKNYDNWQDLFWDAFHYLQDNKVLVLNTFNSVGRSYLENRLKVRLAPVVENMLDRRTGGMNLSEQDREFVVHLYTVGMISVMFDWFANNMRDGDEEQMQKFLDKIDCSIEATVAGFATK